VTVTGTGANPVTTASDGRYLLALPAGAVRVTANPNNTYAAGIYSSESLDLTVSAGTLTDAQNITLSQAGSIRGHFKTSSNSPLPARVAVALSGGSQAAQASSDGSGNFYLKNISTGTYVIQAALDPAETVSPSSVTVSITSAGSTVWSTSFTVSNGLAEVAGNVATASGTPIKTGVYVLASTVSLGGTSTTPAPAMSGTTGCTPCYYETSSDASGSYSLSLRASATPYQVYGWYTTIDASGAAVSTRVGPYSVTVSTPSTTVTQDLTW
jgi:hypothetical protein